MLVEGVAFCPEYAFDPRALAITTVTHYPGFEVAGTDNDSVRGNLTLENLRELVKTGCEVYIFDTKVSKGFLMELAKINGIKMLDISHTTMSRDRVATIGEPLKDSRIQAVMWAEPEKPMHDHFKDLATPVLNGEADVVVMNRNKALLRETYPPEQLQFEIRANRLFNQLLHECNLLPEDVELDAWSGPRVFSKEILTDPEIFGKEMHLQDRYKELMENEKFGVDLDTEKWFNAIFAPLILALHKGKKVIGVEVPFRYPEIQRTAEASDPAIINKRRIQYNNILTLSIQLLNTLGYRRFNDKIFEFN